ncbi:hypothetical protein NUACC26_045770 [Scytonema sp. NUACC26]
MKVTTQLRHELENFGNINSDVLQRNIAKLDSAFSNFWKNGRGFPSYLRVLDCFEYKPGQVKLVSIRSTYAVIYLPGIGNIKMHNSRDLTLIKQVRTCTVKRSGGYWFISMLVDIPGELPKFICTNCQYTEHADTKASRTIALRVGLVFPKNVIVDPTYGLWGSHACEDIAAVGRGVQEPCLRGYRYSVEPF